MFLVFLLRIDSEIFDNVFIPLDLPISNLSLIEISKSGKMLRIAVSTFDGSSEGLI